MSEKYKLGLTRNRLFEFDNCVVFAGKYDTSIEALKGEKAIKLLSLKEPLITAKIELEGNGDAFVVVDEVEQKLNFCNEDCNALLDKYKSKGLSFWEKVFEFSLSSDGYFIIAGHTCIADAKSLLRLAVYFSEIYNSNGFSVEPSDVSVISEKSQLPLEVLSPVTDKLSVELDSKWAGKSVTFGVEDYLEAKSRYDSVKGECAEIKQVISAEAISALQACCKENSVDASSVVAFAFYEALCDDATLKASRCKMNVYGDSRFFFHDYEKYGIGAYNGVVNVYLRKKDRAKTDIERLKAFHINAYKGVTSTFKVFYDDVFLMSVSPSLCDSAYMYAAGCFKNKTSAKIADNYGCKNEMLCDFFSCNLDQQFWSELVHFSDVTIKEPFKMRGLYGLNFVLKNGKGYITFEYRKTVCNDKKAEEILKNAVGFITRISQK